MARIARNVASRVTVISPSKGLIPVDLRAVWEHRELLYFLVWRDIKLRYKQTLLGASWAIIQPLSLMVIFSIFLGLLLKIPSGDAPYALFFYSALVPWTLFAEAMGRSSNSLVADASLVQKVYFPRLLLPLASILSPLFDFVMAFVVLIGMMLFFGYVPGIRMLWLPAFLLMELTLALGVGLWLSAINVEYRDLRYAIPFVVQVWFFVSPIIYSSSLVPARFQAVYGLNPMAGVIQGFRWAILGAEQPGYLLIASVAITIVILVSGAFYFRHREKAFADMV